MEIDLFAGRFHPLFVHLPIGFILLAFLLELLSWSGRKAINQSLIAFIYLLGGISAVMAVISGLLLSESNAYPPDTLRQHQWMGISTTVLAFVLYLLKSRSTGSIKLVMALGVIVSVMVGITGHLGGNLTHGETYLVEYAPDFIRKLASVDSDTPVFEEDSIAIYAGIIRPALESKCMACHNTEDAYGGLNLTVYDGLFIKGETGTPVIPGNAAESEIYKRITASHSSRKFMPPYGEEFDFGEIQVLKYWIDEGADSAMIFKPGEMDADFISQLKRDFGIDLTVKPFYEKEEIDSLSPEVLEELREFGFTAAPLSQINNYLDVRFIGDSLDIQAMQILSKSAGHVVFADLHGSSLNDRSLAPISAFSNLIRLDIHENDLSDSAVDHLMNLKRLEVINIYKTSISDAGLEKLMTLPALKRIYSLETGVTPAFVESARRQYPELEIVSSFEFDIPDTTKTESSR